MLHSLLHGLLRSAEMGLHRSSLFHENKGGASLGLVGGIVAGAALASTPLGWGIVALVGTGGGALVEKGIKRSDGATGRLKTRQRDNSRQIL